MAWRCRFDPAVSDVFVFENTKQHNCEIAHFFGCCFAKMTKQKKEIHLGNTILSHCRIRTCIFTLCVSSSIWAKWVFVRVCECVCLCGDKHFAHTTLNFLFFFSFFFFFFPHFLENKLWCVWAFYLASLHPHTILFFHFFLI